MKIIVLIFRSVCCVLNLIFWFAGFLCFDLWVSICALCVSIFSIYVFLSFQFVGFNFLVGFDLAWWMCIRIRLTTSIETTTRRSQNSDPCGATRILFFKRTINMVRFKNTLNPNQTDQYPSLILTYVVHFMIIYLYHQAKKLISFLCKWGLNFKFLIRQQENLLV